MTTSGIAGRNVKKINTLTSLRFFAAAMIVSAHGYKYYHFPSFHIQIPARQGVSFFLVLSGFILAYVYPELPSLKHVARFIGARFARIWPIHIASIILILCLFPFPLWNVSPSYPVLFSVANILMVHAWIPVQESCYSLNGVSWTVSTEFFFYLCFPLLIYKWHHTWFQKMLVVASILITIICISNALDLPSSASYKGVGAHFLIYVHPLSRLFEFTLGIMACGLFKVLNLQSNRISFIQASLIEAIIVSLTILVLWLIRFFELNKTLVPWIGEAGMVWFQSSGGAIFFFALIIVFALQKGFFSTILQWPFLVLLGEVSYCLYLVHTIVLKYFDFHNLFVKEWSYLSYWLLSIIIAYLFYRSIEIPCRSFLLKLIRRESPYNKNTTGAMQQIMPAIWKRPTFWLIFTLVILIIVARQLNL